MMIFDEFDRIQADDQRKQTAMRYIQKQQHRRRKQRQIGGCLILAISCLLLIIQPWKQLTSAPVTSAFRYVSLDINPSMEWKLDAKNTIVSIRTYNTEGEQLISDMQLEGKQLKDALAVLLADASFHDYLNSGILEVSVYASDTDASLQLEDEINRYLRQELSQTQYHCSHLDEETHHEAQSHHMSGGKYRVIEEIIKQYPSLSLEDLRHKSMKELYAYLGEDTTTQPSCHDEHHGHHS